eukprot:346107_1
MLTTEIHTRTPVDFDFDKWITDNQLTEIKDCLKDYNMTTLDNLDLNSSNALNMMRDERLKKKPQLIPILMSRIIELRIALPSMASSEQPEPSMTMSHTQSALSVPTQRNSPQTPPISPLSAASKPFFAPMPTALTMLTLDERRSLRVGDKESRAHAHTMTGINIALSGLNINNCTRSNFDMNSIETYSKGSTSKMTDALETESIQSHHNATSLRAIWVLNVSFYVFMILFICFYLIQMQNVSWFFVGFMCVAWCLYTFEWAQWMLLNSDQLKQPADLMIYDKAMVCEEVKRLIQETPIIKWRVRCYHTKKQNEIDRVETLRKDTIYSFTSWNDISSAFPSERLDGSALMKLTIHKTFSFVNETIKDDYYHRAEVFRVDNDNEDEDQCFEQWIELQGWLGHKFTSEAYKQRSAQILVKSDTNDNMYSRISKLWFTLFSCLMCSACYRVYCARKMKIEHIEYVIRKEISL